jgi:hypothetical protein
MEFLKLDYKQFMACAEYVLSSNSLGEDNAWWGLNYVCTINYMSQNGEDPLEFVNATCSQS